MENFAFDIGIGIPTTPVGQEPGTIQMNEIVDVTRSEPLVSIQRPIFNQVLSRSDVIKSEHNLIS